MLAASMIVLLVCLQLVACALAVNNPYSLQPAVDALQRREAQLWHYSQPMRKLSYDDRDADEDEAYESLPNDDEQYFDERKRSMFRERGDIPDAHQPSAFRERELTQPELAAQFLDAYGQERPRQQQLTQSELAAQFLEAIDRNRHREQQQQQQQQQQQYQPNLSAQSWPQDNDMDTDYLFENENQHYQPAAFASPNDERRYQYVNMPAPRDRTTDERFAGVAYGGDGDDILGSVMEKRRLIMPFMPVRKRSFPMQKRSSPTFPAMGRTDGSLSGTDEKVARELQAIFSAAPPMKSKRSSPVAEPAVPVEPAAAVAPSASPALPTASEAATATVTATADESSIAQTEKKDARAQRDQGDNHDLDHDGFLAEHEAGHASHHRGHEHDHDDHDHDHDHDHEHDDGEGEHDGDIAHEHDEDEDEDSSEAHDDEHDDRKRKRDAAAVAAAAAEAAATAAAVKKVVAKRGNQEVLKEDQIIPGDLSDFKRKKSVEWSKYFGIDRRKKSAEWSAPMAEKPKSLEDYAPTHFRNHDQVVARPSKLQLEENKLERMGEKLKGIEEHIIDQTMKFTAEHEGMSDPEDIKKLRDHVLARLQTAYSLEKMRRALEKLQQSFDQERHLEENELEMARMELETDGARRPASADASGEAPENKKRVAVKKEKVEFDNNRHSIDAVTERNANGNGDALVQSNNDDDAAAAVASLHRAADKKSAQMMGGTRPHQQAAAAPRPVQQYKKRPAPSGYDALAERLVQQQEAAVAARAQNNAVRGFGGGGFGDTMAERYAPIDEYTVNAVADDECPLLDAIEKRCRAINLLSGDTNQEFLQLCGVHQLCYLCATSRDSCDYEYTREAESICKGQRGCHSSAKTALRVLRESAGPPVGMRMCVRNSCVKRALIDIGAI